MVATASAADPAGDLHARGVCVVHEILLTDWAPLKSINHIQITHILAQQAVSVAFRKHRAS